MKKSPHEKNSPNKILPYLGFIIGFLFIVVIVLLFFCPQPFLSIVEESMDALFHS